MDSISEELLDSTLSQHVPEHLSELGITCRIIIGMAREGRWKWLELTTSYLSLGAEVVLR